MIDEKQSPVSAEPRVRVRSFADAVAALAERDWAQGTILDESDLAPEFFDLHSGLAGELFQKFVNYGLRVAIVVPNPGAHGQRFGELAYEHRAHSVVRILRSRADAEAWLRAACEDSGRREAE